VQQKAVEELETLPQNNPLRNKAIDLLLSLKTQIEVKQNPDEEDREALMGLSPIYLQRLAEAEQKGVQNERRTVIENLLQARFGTLDNELKEIIQPLLGLTPEEFSPLLIQLSREELLSRFRQE
jgi:hypothetical protein